MSSLQSGLAFKQKTGKKYVAIFGKTFIDETSEEYIKLQEFAGKVVENNLGVVHGGYIGLMKAVSDGANNVIHKNNKNKELNIGVIEEKLEANNVPKADCVHTTPAKGIMERADTIIQLSDYVVISEKGGFGTLLEMIGVFHMNQLNKKFGGTVRPIIFVGNVWQKLYSEIIASLDMHNQDDGKSFIHFVTSYNDALDIIKNNN